MSRFRITAALAVAVLALAACSSGQSLTSGSPGASTSDAESLTVYSGRSEELIAPLFARFTEEIGIELAARYGESAELAAQLDTLRGVTLRAWLIETGLLDLTVEQSSELLDRLARTMFASDAGGLWLADAAAAMKAD